MTVCAMIAFACNRRCNGLQLQNAVSLLACGVSARVHDYLFSIGLLSSRKTAVKAVDALARKAVKNIKETFSKPYSIRPFICVDNIDFETRIHHKRIEEATRQFHRSGGYCHIVNNSTNESAGISDESSVQEDSALYSPRSSESSDTSLIQDSSSDSSNSVGAKVIENVPTEESQDDDAEDNPYSLGNFLHAMQNNLDTPVSLSEFLPTQRDAIHWEKTVKTQMNRAWLELVLPASTDHPDRTMPKLEVKPPTIDQIEVEVPAITMLKMMDSPENSAEGMGQLLVMIQKQLGIYEAPHATALQVIKGDLGTCINLEGLRKKRRPRLHSDESLDHILTLPGAAHTLWNIGQAVVLHHWGEPENSGESGVWRFWEALGGKK